MEHLPSFPIIAVTCAASSIIWLLWTLFKSWVMGDIHKRIMHGLRRRMVGVCTVCSLFLMLLTFLGLSYCETYWIQKDVMLSVSPEMPTLQYEAEITRIGDEEIIRAMRETEP